MSECPVHDNPAERGGNAGISVAIWYSAAGLIITRHKQHGESSTLNMSSGMHNLTLTMDGPQLESLFIQAGMALADVGGADHTKSAMHALKDTLRIALDERRVYA